MVFLLSKPGARVGRAVSSPDTAPGLAAHVCPLLKNLESASAGGGGGTAPMAKRGILASAPGH